MKVTSALPIWTLVIPLIAAVFYLIGLTNINGFTQIIGAILLIGSVLAAVFHAEIIAHKVGEPFGTIILALAITVLEVGIVITMMMSGGEGASEYARDTVFAAIMLILNGILGACLLIGGLKHFEQYFVQKSVGTALVALVSIVTLCLILPNFTTSAAGPIYSGPQMVLVAITSLVIYCTFILVQTVRHRDYFLMVDESDIQALEDNHSENFSHKIATTSFIFLLICLAIVVFISKALSPAVENIVANLGAPRALVGVIIATIVLLPEGLAALRAAYNNRLQTSLNLILGSALASIGLTIPAVAIICLIMDIPLVLGLPWKSMILMALSIFTVMLSLNHGKTNVLYGVVLLVNLVTYVFTVIVP